MDDPTSKVTIEFNEPLSHYGISHDLVDQALRDGVRQYLLEDAEFRALIRKALEDAGAKISWEALQEAFKASIAGALQEKIDAQRKELSQCLADYHNWFQVHASEYAQRRFKELQTNLAAIDKM